MDESSAHAAIERHLQAANTQDFDAVRDLFADDVLVEWPQSGERVRGKEACINVSRGGREFRLLARRP